MLQPQHKKPMRTFAIRCLLFVLIILSIISWIQTAASDEKQTISDEDYNLYQVFSTQPHDLVIAMENAIEKEREEYFANRGTKENALDEEDDAARRLPPSIDILGAHDSYVYLRIPKKHHNRRTSFLSKISPINAKVGQLKYIGESSVFSPSGKRKKSRSARRRGRRQFFASPDAPPMSMLPPFLNGIPAGYSSPDSLRKQMIDLKTEYPQIVELVDISKKFGPGATMEKRPIWALHIQAPETPVDSPSVLFASCHHARELITPEIAMAVAKRLLQGYLNGDESRQFVKNNDIWIIPVVNADGHEYVWNHDNMWRKNRRPLSGGVFGVDLNRNYDLGWETQGGSADLKSETYRGEKPFSEPESQTVAALSRAMNFAKVMDFHSSGRQVLMHYTRTAMPENVKKFIEAESTKLARLANYGVRTPSDDGEHQEWQIKRHTSYSFLVETGTSFQPAFSDALKEVDLVWPIVVSFLNRTIPVRGVIRDAVTRKPIGNAQYSVKQIEWKAGEERHSHPQFGSYHVFINAGKYDIIFSAPNYENQVIPIQIEENAPTLIQDVYLSPKGSKQ